MGPVEHNLLRLLWKRAPLSARALRDAYNATVPRPLAYTTVMTLLNRLVEKSAVAVDRDEQPFQFRPLITREQVLRQRVRDFVDFFFDGRSIDLAVRLVEEEPLSDEACDRLEAILQKARATPRGQ